MKRAAQAMIEAALLMPLFIMLILGTAALNLTFISYHRLQFAVVEGARYGAIFHKSEPEITARVQSLAPGGTQDRICPSACAGWLAWCTQSPDNDNFMSPCGHGNVVNVTATHKQAILVPFLPVSEWNLYATASVVYD